MCMIKLYHLVYKLGGCKPTSLTFGKFIHITSFVSNEIQNVDHDDSLSAGQDVDEETNFSRSQISVFTSFLAMQLHH